MVHIFLIKWTVCVYPSLPFWPTEFFYSMNLKYEQIEQNDPGLYEQMTLADELKKNHKGFFICPLRPWPPKALPGQKQQEHVYIVSCVTI